eukprot:scaffold865_cov87-Cylindrotheca_fusiformis.AAC.4
MDEEADEYKSHIAEIDEEVTPRPSVHNDIDASEEEDQLFGVLSKHPSRSTWCSIHRYYNLGNSSSTIGKKIKHKKYRFLQKARSSNPPVNKQGRLLKERVPESVLRSRPRFRLVRGDVRRPTSVVISKTYFPISGGNVPCRDCSRTETKSSDATILVATMRWSDSAIEDDASNVVLELHNTKLPKRSVRSSLSHRLRWTNCESHRTQTIQGQDTADSN